MRETPEARTARYERTLRALWHCLGWCPGCLRPLTECAGCEGGTLLGATRQYN
jgi:hypothetical protein